VSLPPNPAETTPAVRRRRYSVGTVMVPSMI
jgi:hypothetical protein